MNSGLMALDDPTKNRRRLGWVDEPERSPTWCGDSISERCGWSSGWGLGKGLGCGCSLGGFVWDVGVLGILGLVGLDLSLVWIGCLFIQVRPGMRMTDLDGKDHHLFNGINRDCSTLEPKLHCYRYLYCQIFWSSWEDRCEPARIYDGNIILSGNPSCAEILTNSMICVGFLYLRGVRCLFQSCCEYLGSQRPLNE